MPGAQCLRCRPLKGKGKGVLGARETRGAREEGGKDLCLHYRVVSLGRRRNRTWVRDWSIFIACGRGGGASEDFSGGSLDFWENKRGEQS